MTRLEHVNVTVADPATSADLLCRLFGWRIRWQGPGMTTGRTIHVGGDDSYVALFTYGDARPSREESYRTIAGLNHIAVVVGDLDATEARVKAAGLTPMNHADYEPGRRFYFDTPDGIEIEVVSYG
ncbi:MAG: VOC family protein [Exiguobacterium profundum]|nr:MAG: VOC family protein [Exiguobacterium profundum]